MLRDYAIVVVVVTAAATVAGAIGSGFDSEDSVREAAYSYRERERERERRQALRHSQHIHKRQQRSGGQGNTGT